VAGAPVWLKPLKFALSITAFAWTLGWLLADLPAAAQRSVLLLSGGVALSMLVEQDRGGGHGGHLYHCVALSMLVEQAVIFTQAARGTTSHYNASTPLNGILFGLMGIFIMVNTLMTVWAVYLAWRYQPHGPAG
jgi:hypothetical protein